MRRIRVFLFNGILLTVTSLLLRTIEVSFNVYISNKVGAEAVGVFGLLMSVYLFAITLSLSGIHLACMRVVAEELACGYEQNIKKVVRRCVQYSLFFGGLAGFLFAVFAPMISQHWLHNMISCVPLYIIAISLPFISLSSALNGYFSAVRRAAKTAFSQIFEQVIKILLVTYFLSLFFPTGIEYACISLVLGTTISEVGSFLLLWIFYLWDRRQYDKQGLSSQESCSKRILKISLPIAFTSYIRSGLSTFKQLLIPLRLEKSGISCSHAISQYGMINGMAMPLIMFPSVFIQSFSNLLIPEFSYYYVKKEMKSIHAIIARILKVTFVFSIAMMGVFWCFSEDFSQIFYHTNEIAPYLKILSPLIILIYIDSVVDCMLKGLDKQVQVMGINILDLVVSISCIWFLLPSYGLIGYLVVLFISELLNGGFSLFQLWKFTHFKLDFNNWILKPLCAMVGSIFVTYLLPFHLQSSILETILCILVFLIAYFMILISIGGVKKKDIRF